MSDMAAKRTFQIVVAATRQMGIGKDGGLPWRLPGDMAYFKALTSQTSAPGKQNAVVMGRKTWESIPTKFRPLAGRVNIVLTRSPPGDENTAPGSAPPAAPIEGPGVHVCSSLDGALASLASGELADLVENVFVIGGGQVYKEAIESLQCAAVHLTAVEADMECDTHFPSLEDAKFRLWSSAAPRSDKDVGYSFHCYARAGAGAPPMPAGAASRHEEYQYLDMIADIMKTGNVKGDRTGTGTISKFGTSMRFNLRNSFPLLTTKRVFWRGVAEELLWFVKGSTNAKLLQDKGIHIWDGNGSREYLDSIGHKDREEWDLGPVYGFQWRHFGAKYVDMHTDYTGQGFDQLADVIHKIKNNPNDRRIIMSAWNPADLSEMALPPCHMFCQFYVANGELSCQMYQRSCDLGLGVPFNIASYSLLTLMIAQVCGLKPGEFVHVLGDAHVYSNHVEPLEQQLKNEPRAFPVLRINPDKTEIDSFTMEDFELVGYEPHKKIEMKMAV